MSKPTLLVISPDEKYMAEVAAPALSRGFVADVVAAGALRGPVTSELFAEKMAAIGHDNIIIAKGMIETADFLRLILKYDNKALIKGGENGFLSHVAMFSKDDCYILMSDGALNVYPSAEQKLVIAKNAARVADCICGNKSPTISMLTLSGKLNPKVQSSVDGQYVIDNLPEYNIRLDQLDTAIDESARAAKGLGGGIADILIVDGVDTGNAIWKCLTIFGGYRAAGFVMGATVPIVLNSRSDTSESKLYSIMLAGKLAG